MKGANNVKKINVSSKTLHPNSVRIISKLQKLRNHTKIDPIATIRPPFCVILRADSEKHTPDADFYLKRKKKHFFDRPLYIFAKNHIFHNEIFKIELHTFYSKTHPKINSEMFSEIRKIKTITIFFFSVVAKKFKTPN